MTNHRLLTMKPSIIIAIALTLLIIVLQSMFWFNKGGYINHVNYLNILETETANNLTLKNRNDKLKAQIYSLQNETDAIEEQARSQLGLIKDGETLFHIITNPDNDRPESVKLENQTKPSDE
jgi:Septum formation initiator